MEPRQLCVRLHDYRTRDSAASLVLSVCLQEQRRHCLYFPRFRDDCAVIDFGGPARQVSHALSPHSPAFSSLADREYRLIRESSSWRYCRTTAKFSLGVRC